MMDTVIRNVVVFHVFAVIALFSWVMGGTRSDLLEPSLPWFYAILLTGMLFFPQYRSHESVVDARVRTWDGLKRDPLFWVSTALVVWLALPFTNRMLCPSCDHALIASGSSPDAPYPWLPSCFNIRAHYQVFSWFVFACTSALAIKHSMLKRGKRLLMEMLCWNATALAVLGFIQQVTGAPGPLWTAMVNLKYGYEPFFSVWGYPNMAGAFFTFFFAVSVGMWQYRAQQMENAPRDHEFDSRKAPKNRFLRAHYMLFAVGANFFAAIETLSRAAIILSCSLLIVLFVYVFGGYFSRLNKLGQIKLIAVGILMVVFGWMSVVLFTPNSVKYELKSVSDIEALDRITARAGDTAYHGKVVSAIIKDNLFFGCGGWGYRHLMTPYFLKAYPDPKRRPLVMSQGAINVHNDYMQFLCEHGLIGFLLMTAFIALLVLPVGSAWRRRYKATQFLAADKRPPKPVVIYCMPTLPVAVFAGLTVLAVHATIDCPLRSPAVLVGAVMAVAAIDGFMPHEPKE